MTILISAIICTHNRAGYLRKAVRSLVDQSLPKEEYEILVIDNRSSDGTRELISEEFSEVTNLRYIFEPILGHSHARNTGWRSAGGRYIAYLDDDAMACPNWLEMILKVIDNAEYKVGCLGGKIEGIWESPRPPWLSDGLAMYLAVLDFSDTPVIAQEGFVHTGANVAYPREVLEQLSGFSTAMGREGKKLRSGDESELWWRIRRAGYWGIYHPEVVVKHHIPAERLEKGWFYKRLYWEGASAAIRERQLDPISLHRRLGRAATALSVGASLRVVRARLCGADDDPKVFDLQCGAIRRLGYAAAMVGLSQ